jgi:hypothetical protein
MLLAEVRRHPDDRGGIRPGRIRKELAEMSMIGRGKLILNDQHAVIRLIPSDQVERETSHRVFSSLQRQVDPKHLSQMLGVLEEPRSEVMRLVWPNRARIDY